jgi:hypothetical protein
MDGPLVCAATNVSVRNQRSDVRIGYRDDAQRFVIGMLWDSAATGVAATRLYEILIRSRSRPPRKPMRRMALQGLVREQLYERFLSLTRRRDARATPEISMLSDLIMLALGFGFFAAAIGYTYACERL